MSLDMSGKRILVTGGSRGIGAGFVRAFDYHGGEVHYTFKSKEFSKKSVGSFNNTHSYKVDMRNQEEISNWALEFVNRYRSIDVLVNNVGGIIKRSSFRDSSPKLWNDTMNLNLLSLVTITRSILPALEEAAKLRGDACILNISSISAIHGGANDSTHYASAKGAICTLTKGLAKELASKKIRVNALLPSAIATDFQREHSSASRLQQIVDGTPLKRIGEVKDVTGIGLALADSNLCSYITGQTIGIDGGRF